MSLSHLTLAEAQEGLKAKEFSSVELVRDCLEKIKKADKKIHAFLSVFEEGALQEAKDKDNNLQPKRFINEPLAGMPIAIKDNLLRFGDITTAGSKILENYKASYTATTIERLEKAGAIIIGRTNMDEFAMGSSTENSAFGPTMNPWDTRRVPGGSSGGSAAAVVADMCIAALGSDTAGSIRQPASFCGCVGFKPTYGMVSRYGLIAMASSLDQIGPLTKSVKDAAQLTDVMSGKDEYDATTSKRSRANLLETVKNYSIKGIRIGVPREYFPDDLNPEIAKQIKERTHALELAGARVEEVNLPIMKYSLPAYYIITPAEISANLGRFDGIRYGFSDRSGRTLESIYLKSRSKGFGAEVRRRIIIGTYTLSSGYYDAFYGRAQKVQALIKKSFDEVFTKVDMIITPTAPNTAFDIGAKIADPVEMYLQDIFTVSANIAGLPAISLPLGLVNNMPIGLQIMGRQFDDASVLGLGSVLEEQINFSRLEYD